MNERFETFTVLINRLNRSIRKIKNLEMAAYDLKSIHVSCLYYLATSENLTSAELCQKCDEDKATISRSLDLLEERGFISPRETGARRYKSAITLTEKGSRAASEVCRKVDKVMTALTAELTDEERHRLYRSLIIISRALENIGAGLESENSIEKT